MYPEIRSQRPAVSFRRWLLTVTVLCLPILAAVVFSGALGGGAAYAAPIAIAPASHGTETEGTGTPGGTGTAGATGTAGTHTPEATETEGTHTPGATETEGTHTPVVTGTPEGTHTPGTTGTPQTTGTPEGTHTPGVTGTPQVTGTPGQLFSDVNTTDYFYTPVMDLFSRGAISGYPDGTFRPYNNITRGQVAKVVVLAQQWTLLNPATASFDDVAVGSTFYQYVETAVQHGVVSGYPDRTYRPNTELTRGQIAKIMVLARQWPLLNPATATFGDVPNGSTFYQYVETAFAHTVLGGYPDGTFRPNNTATRGQASKIIYNAITGAR